jgi:nicotinamide-nucleotide amidase
MNEMLKTAKRLIDACRAHKLELATAESCTGGLIAAAITEIASASDVFDRGFVTYSNESKSDMLGVREDLLAEFGAVSDRVVEAMALGVLANSRAHLALAVSGVAGPTGGTADKPVGTVYFAVAREERPVKIVRKNFSNHLSRAEIRQKSAEFGLSLLLEAVEPHIIA